MEKFNEIIDNDPTNPSWDDTPTEPTALAYTPDPVEEKVFITEAYAHDVVKLAEIVNGWMERGHIETASNASPIAVIEGNIRCFLSVDTNFASVKEVVRISNQILARGEE